MPVKLCLYTVSDKLAQIFIFVSIYTVHVIFAQVKVTKCIHDKMVLYCSFVSEPLNHIHHAE